ncbi:MAG TPA: GNAT family N-acetyltransferase [Steroidobacteraceae bacterium]|nr:GNAT family N-acetyltransferase [Steroidobacteraceae bacterium]
MRSAVDVIEVRDATLLPLVRELLREYAAWIGVDLGFQDFERELATLPGRYAPPGGCLLLARAREEVAGCVAMRPLVAEICEMKRLWVREAFRGSGAGAQLSRAVMRRAADAGYAVMRLDTLAHMTAAQRLYRSLGFVEIAPYYDNPLPGVTYLEARLCGPSKTV